MKSYWWALLGIPGILFLLLWGFAATNYGSIAFPEYRITKAHTEMISACDLGNVDFVGDSTAIADLMPSRVGPGVRDFGLGGGTPLETYYIVHSMLKCKNRPRYVALEFVPSALGDDPGFPDPEKTFFWSKAYQYRVLNFAQAMEALKYSNRYNSKLIIGTPSLFNIDYRVKALLYAVRFPPYFMPELDHYANDLRSGLRGRDAARSDEMYGQTMLDDGHHFFGTQPYSTTQLDHDSDRTDHRIAPLQDFYLRRTMQALHADGIQVLLIEPPRQVTSFLHYPPGLVDDFQNYLLDLQSSGPDVHLIGNGMLVWAPPLFGDESHLDLRGGLIYSEMMRETLGLAGVPALYDPAALTQRNLYNWANADPVFWAAAPGDAADSITPAGSIALPDLEYPAGPVAWQYHAQFAGAWASPGIAGQPIPLAANSYYAISVMVKNVDANEASLKISWPGGIRGKITWNFPHRSAIYSGSATPMDSGVSICPGGWNQLYITGRTGPEAGDYAGPIVSLAAAHDATAELYDVTLEHGLWPTNYCKLAPQEAKTIPLQAGVVAAEN